MEIPCTERRGEGSQACSDPACAPSAHRYSCEWGGVAAGQPYVAGLDEFGQLVLQDVWSVIQKLYVQVSRRAGGQGSGEGVRWEVTWWGL